jgi:hypothetical protein
MKPLTLLLLAALATACAHSGSTTSAKCEPDRIASADATEAGRLIATSCLAEPWLQSFVASKGRAPVLRLRPIENRTGQPINLTALSKAVETELAGSNKVKLVAGNAPADLILAGVMNERPQFFTLFVGVADARSGKGTWSKMFALRKNPSPAPCPAAR